MTIGQVKDVTIEASHPVKMKYDVLDLRMLTLMTGMNGTGKTFLLISFWIAAYLMAAAIAGRAMPGFDLIAMAQYVFDRSFDDQDITGTYAFTFTSGPTLNMELEKGKVKSCVAMIDGVDQVSGVKYMSSRMRTFDAISGYLKMRAMHEKTITDPRLLMGEMIKDYKIYDVTYIEQMIHSMPFTDMEKIKPSFANFDIEDDIRSFGVDLIKGDFYARIGDDERIKYLCTYGNGHQALFNMILGGAI